MVVGPQFAGYKVCSSGEHKPAKRNAQSQLSASDCCCSRHLFWQLLYFRDKVDCEYGHGRTAMHTTCMQTVCTQLLACRQAPRDWYKAAEQMHMSALTYHEQHESRATA